MNRLRSIAILFVALSTQLLLLPLASCSRPDTVAESVLDLPSGGKWLRFEPQEVTVSIPNSDDCYELHVSAIIDTALYRGSSLPLTLKVSTPQGERRTIFADLLLVARDGHTLGQPCPDGPAGSLLFNQRIREYFYFNQPGDHTVSIGQRTTRYEIQGIRQVRFTVRKAKLEYPK